MREERKVHVKLESHQTFVVDEKHRKLTTCKSLLCTNLAVLTVLYKVILRNLSSRQGSRCTLYLSVYNPVFYMYIANLSVHRHRVLNSELSFIRVSIVSSH